MSADEYFKKVLIVEDDYAFRDPLRDFLSVRSLTIITADNGEQAMEKLLFHKPHMIILDMLMPKVDGFEFLRRIRSFPEPDIANIPVIVLSNLSSPKDIEQAQELKVDAYFIKSETTNDEVFRKVQEVLYKDVPPPKEEVLDFRKYLEK